LPADIRQWTDLKEGIPSALTDNEIGAALVAIRAKGAFVWIVIDACHSGTATRAVGTAAEDVTERMLKPEQLGIPLSAIAEATAAAGAAATTGSEDEEGNRALALYASEKTAGMQDEAGSTAE